MPQAAKKFGARAFDERRSGTKLRSMYDRKWRRRREAKLVKNPLCEECERQGLLTLANEVDHVIPHRGDRELFDDDANLQSLCKPCHSRKTKRGE